MPYLPEGYVAGGAWCIMVHATGIRMHLSSICSISYVIHTQYSPHSALRSRALPQLVPLRLRLHVRLTSTRRATSWEMRTSLCG